MCTWLFICPSHLVVALGLLCKQNKGRRPDFWCGTASWIPPERAECQTDCTFVRESYRALEIAVDVYLDKHSSWTQMTGKPPQCEVCDI
jgi:hypothetical protein